MAVKKTSKTHCVALLKKALSFVEEVVAELPQEAVGADDAVTNTHSHLSSVAVNLRREIALLEG